jgi:arabinofuranosyltransferase
MDEDAFINLRVIDQIFAGHGPVFNAGERVEPATSTLWVFVLVVGRAIFGAFASMEWITLLASLLCAVAAFVVAGMATRALHRGDEGVVVPVGLLLVASVAVVWDFSTSGLEMGLVWLWIAGSWYALVVAARSEEIAGRRRFALAALLGLGPLVRPDLTLMLLCFGVAWFVLARPTRHSVSTGCRRPPRTTAACAATSS